MTSATPPKKKPGLKAQKPQAPSTPHKLTASETVEAELSQLKAEIKQAQTEGDYELLLRLQLQLQVIRDSIDSSPEIGSAFTVPLPSATSTTLLNDSQPVVELSHEALIQEQLLWVRKTGPTPVEFLARAYRNPVFEMRDRVAAAKALLDYTHRKLAHQDAPPTKDQPSASHKQSLKEKLIARLTAESAAKG